MSAYLRLLQVETSPQQGQLGRAEKLLTDGLAIRPFAEGKANLGIVLSDMGKCVQLLGSLIPVEKL